MNMTKYEQEAPDLLTMAQALTISSPAEFAQAGDLLQFIKSAQKEWAAEIKPQKQAIDEAKRRILEHERKVSAPLDEAERLLRTRRLEYTQRVEQDRVAEQARRQAEADAASAAERARLQAAAINAETADGANALLEAAEQIQAPVVLVPSILPKTQGVIQSRHWIAEVVDEALVPREFLVVDTKKLQGHARVHGDQIKVPGVRFKQVTREAVRTAS